MWRLWPTWGYGWGTSKDRWPREGTRALTEWLGKRVGPQDWGSWPYVGQWDEEVGSHGCSASENSPNIIPKWRGGWFPDLNPRERFSSRPWNGLACVDQYGWLLLTPSVAKVKYLMVAMLSWSEIATRNLTGDQRIAPSRVICSIYGGGTLGGWPPSREASSEGPEICHPV